LGNWDELTPLEAVDCTSLPEDASTQDERKITSSKAPIRAWPKLRVFKPPL
jgi:hypothetical protein